MIFHTDSEREIYLAELAQLRGIGRMAAQRCAEHAVDLERRRIRKTWGTGDDGVPFEEKSRGTRAQPLPDGWGESVEIIWQAACSAFGVKRAEFSMEGPNRFNHAHAPVRWYAMTALQAAFSQCRAAEIMAMSDAGVGNGAHNLRRKFPEKHVEAVEIGKRLKPVPVEKGRAA